jgi:hypothetical protein
MCFKIPSWTLLHLRRMATVVVIYVYHMVLFEASVLASGLARPISSAIGPPARVATFPPDHAGHLDAMRLCWTKKLPSTRRSWNKAFRVGGVTRVLACVTARQWARAKRYHSWCCMDDDTTSDAPVLTGRKTRATIYARRLCPSASLDRNSLTAFCLMPTR